MDILKCVEIAIQQSEIYGAADNKDAQIACLVIANKLMDLYLLNEGK